MKKNIYLISSYKLAETNSSLKKCTNYNSFFASFDAALIYSKWIFNGHPQYATFILLHALFTVLEIDCFAFFNQTAEDKCSNMTVLEHMKVSDNADLK